MRRTQQQISDPVMAAAEEYLSCPNSEVTPMDCAAKYGILDHEREVVEAVRILAAYRYRNASLSEPGQGGVSRVKRRKGPYRVRLFG